MHSKPLKKPRARCRGLSLMELMISIAIVSLISVAAFRILNEGLQYLRTNQKATEAQSTGLALLTQIGSGIQGTGAALVRNDPQGIVFASPAKDDGSVEFDPVTQTLLWQKWVCFYYDGDAVTRRERTIAVPAADPGPAPAPSSFSSDPVRQKMGQEITRFQFTQVTSNPPVWKMELTMGDMARSAPYGVELESEVSPRN